MLADQDGVLRWITGSNRAEKSFEQAERDLGEGPCIDAFISGETIWTADLWADPRWQGLAPLPGPTRCAASWPPRWCSMAVRSGPATY